MIKLFKIWFNLFLFFSLPVFGQVTNVIGTVVDGDNTTWFNAKVTATFVPNVNYPNMNQYTVDGIPLTSTACVLGSVPCSVFLNQTVTANASGAFSFAVIDNNQIAPSGSTWKFVIQSYTSATASTFPNIALSGTTQDISSFIHTNITSPRFPAASSQYGGAFGYNTGEISVIPIPGGSFFNVTSGGINVWTCTSAGCAWAFQTVGDFCSTTGCTFTGPLLARNINNICEASQEPGADFVAQFNACAAESYMATGGVITAYGYGNGTFTATTVLVAGTNPAQPITFVLNPSTTFVWNQNLGSSPGAATCAIPLDAGSSMSSLMAGTSGNAFPRTTIKLGSAAVVSDLFCNHNQSGTQEGIVLNGLNIQGNASATMSGALIHLINIFIGTRISNVATVDPFGMALHTDGGSDILFDNNNFADASSTGNYPNPTVQLDCPNHFTFTGGAIQDNGLHNALLVLNSQGSAADNCGPPEGGGAAQPISVKFIGVDFELQAATIGSFSGHMTNVDPIQCFDCGGGVSFDSPFMYGFYGAGQQHIIDFALGSAGFERGPVEVKNLTVAIPAWNIANSVIHNTEPNVGGALGDIFATQDSANTASVASYEWSGSLQAQGNSTGYKDNQYIANLKTYRQGITTKPFDNLPVCVGSLAAGFYDSVSDSTTNVQGQTITGGGFFNVLAYCDGSNWVVAASSTTVQTQGMTICASGCTNTATICTTSGLAWAGGACFVGTFSWPVPFADSNVAVNCESVGTISTGSGTPEAAFISTITKSNVAIGITLMSATTVALTTSEIDCIGSHQ